MPPAAGTWEGIDLAYLDPADPDDRHFLILGEHPELEEALQGDADEVEVDGLVLNPRMHITLHEVVANQLWDDDPPEAWDTARRLRTAGYERHEVLHMLGSAVAGEIWHMLRGGSLHDPERYRGALRALLESWERERG